MRSMEPRAEPMTMFGGPAQGEPQQWAVVDTRVRDAELYWVVAVPRPGLPPHPRPVWGVWADGRLQLSIGGPTMRRDLAASPAVTVHLDDALEVVLLEGRATGPCTDPAVIEAYNRKYDWHYDLAQYGPLTTIAADVVMSWTAAGPGGRDGFTRSGRWRFG